MEQIPKSENSAEHYENQLEVMLADITKEELQQSGNAFVFSVTPEFKIFVSNDSHQYLDEKYGVDLDKTLSEGYIENIDGNLEITFKAMVYQPNPGFRGSENEFENLKVAVKNKIESFVK